MAKKKKGEGLASVIMTAYRYGRMKTLADYNSLKRDKLRREPEILPQFLSETELVFRENRRLKSYVRADNLYDNESIGSVIDTCIRLTIGERGGKPQYTGEGKENAQRIFNAWARHAGWQEGEGWQDVLSMILRAVKVHGDCLVLLDSVLTGNRIRVFDADQITPITEDDFKRWKQENGNEGWRQCHGCVLDSQGQVKGWFVTCLRNRQVVPLTEATFLPSEIARRVSYHRKITQYRGESLLISNARLTEDTSSLIHSEVQAAKNASEISIVVKEAPDAENAELKALLNADDGSNLTDGTGFSADELKSAVSSNSIADSTFDAFAGRSAIATLPNGAEVQELNNAQRPSSAIQSWMTALNDENGKKLGVMSCLSRGRADNSYSSGQIELAISWTQFQEDQKMLERQVVDYVCERLTPEEPYIVEWPRAFEIDPAKAEQTLDAQLRGGRTSFRKILGADWRDDFDQLAEEIEYAREKGILDYLSISQGKSGGTLTAAPEAEESEKDEI